MLEHLSSAIPPFHSSCSVLSMQTIGDLDSAHQACGPAESEVTIFHIWLMMPKCRLFERNWSTKQLPGMSQVKTDSISVSKVLWHLLNKSAACPRHPQSPLATCFAHTFVPDGDQVIPQFLWSWWFKNTIPVNCVSFVSSSVRVNKSTYLRGLCHRQLGR